MSFKARLVYGAAAAVAIAIALASVLVYFIVRNELRAQTDRNLHTEAVQIAGIPHFDATASGYPGVYVIYNAPSLFSSYFQLVGSNGTVEVPSDYGTPRIPVTARSREVAAGKAGAYYTDTKLQGDDTRVYTMPSSDILLSSNVHFAIQVVEQLSSVDHELSRIKLWLLLVSVVGIGLAAGAGLLVARTTLRPVRRLSEAAERVRRTRDLSQRITVEGSDELANLAVTFNAMLESLDTAAQRQRQLVQDASHELRTPLTSLRTNIEVLATADRLPPGEREQLIRDVVDQLGEMTALIAELTELARGEEQVVQLQDVRLDEVVEEAIKRTARNHPDVPIEADLEPTGIVGTPSSLERAIANLLDNAAKWSPPGSPAEVRLAGGELTVRDHGPGIAAEDAPHVFERFYRATSARSMPGSGLGLAIVQQVAEAHRGSVSVESPPGGGTLMRLSLPVLSDTVTSDAVTSAVPPVELHR